MGSEAAAEDRVIDSRAQQGQGGAVVLGLAEEAVLRVSSGRLFGDPRKNPFSDVQENAVVREGS
ncbi:hypothetical protein GCM10010306_103770 [Streptomyces umbrinus]|nr:hypothetical protein GCM10010306_103770 [Streptomyces umbrinus]